MPPIIPVNNPANKGAPEAIAIPKHKGSATRNTTTLEGRSYFKFLLAILRNAENRVPSIKKEVC
ncbi:hypothetical protein GCM10023231_25940 [Olivibacter ginsenosidimutans]|uniref:Uncharacterized protein n=1 Tax=Olivibacter ginsenosidimutans TaxID=1176537 RepID=A0ABP9BJ74_9SPHI